MTKKTGGPAFPAMHFDLTEHEHGMTLRDYFAAKAMQAIMTAGYWNWKQPTDDAERCYEQADAMLKAREQ